MSTTTSNSRPTTTRLTKLVAAVAVAAAVALSLGTTTSAEAATAAPPGGYATPVLSGSGCVLVRQLATYNPSISKPRADQQSSDHRHWDQGCF